MNELIMPHNVGVKNALENMKELGFQIVTSFSHLLHLCDDAFEARQQFFDERSGQADYLVGTALN